MMKRLLMFVAAVTCLCCATVFPQSWTELMSQAEALNKAGKHDSAIQVAEQALENTVLTGTDADSARAQALHRMGNIYYRGTGTNAEARRCWEEALVIWRRLSGQDVARAKTLGNLGAVSLDLEQYADAERYGLEALALKKRAPKVDSLSIAKTLGNLGTAYVLLGRFGDAESYLLESLELKRRLLPDDSETVITARGQLANLYMNVKRYADAQTMILDILRPELAAKNPGAWAGYSAVLVGILNGTGHLNEAESLGIQLLAACDTIPRIPKGTRSIVLKNLGHTYQRLRKLDKAEQCHREDLAISETLYSRGSDTYQRTLYNLSNTFADEHKYREAESLQTAVLAARQQSLGPHHRFVAYSYEALAGIHQASGQLEKALAEADSACTIAQEDFRKTAVTLTQNDALNYSRFLRRAGSRYLSCFAELPQGRAELYPRAAEIALAIKGPVSDEMLQRQQLLSLLSDSNLRFEMSRYVESRKALRQLDMQDASAVSEDTGARRDSLRSTVTSMERALAHRSARFRNRMQDSTLLIDRLYKSIPAGSCLLEFVNFDRFDPQEDSVNRSTLAVTIDQTGTRTAQVLAESEDIASAMRQYRAHVDRIAGSGHLPLQEDVAQYDAISNRLYSLVWKPLKISARDYHRILLAPDGALNLVSFDGLRNGSGRFLGEQFLFQYLSSARSLMRDSVMDVTGEGLLAIGDPDFDASVQSRMAVDTGRGRAKSEGLFAMRGASLRGVQDDCPYLTTTKYERIPYSRNEIERLVAKWPANSPTIKLLDAQASEDNFKRSAAGKKVIHIATHGYFVPETCRDKEKSGDSLNSGQGGPEIDPLLSSGLVLAGANLHGEGTDSAGIDDGILTAAEVVDLDLRGVDLIALSACESGLGEIIDGEGVYGLRRAFQLAGAGTIISSLWAVDDKMSADVLGELYRTGSGDYAARLHDLQLRKLRELRKLRVPDHPFSWAPYVAVAEMN